MNSRFTIGEWSPRRGAVHLARLLGVAVLLAGGFSISIGVLFYADPSESLQYETLETLVVIGALGSWFPALLLTVAWRSYERAGVSSPVGRMRMPNLPETPAPRAGKLKLFAIGCVGAYLLTNIFSMVGMIPAAYAHGWEGPIIEVFTSGGLEVAKINVIQLVPPALVFGGVLAWWGEPDE